MPWSTPTDSRRQRALFVGLLMPVLMLAGCGSLQTASAPADSTASKPAVIVMRSAPPALPPAGSGRGGYYQDDGPGDNIPENLLATPDAEPKVEPYASRGNRPYKVFGKTYVPILDDQPFKQRGIGSWYGKKFHGQKTSSGEPYDMYKMTAAHPTLPIPSYARVTNLNNGRQVIVRVNDRGPFHAGRVIDLSYTAALKLGYLGHGSSQLEVERLLPDEIAHMQANKQTLASGTDATRSVDASVTNRAAAPAERWAVAAKAVDIVPARIPSPLPSSATTERSSESSATPVAYAVPATPAVVVEPAAATVTPSAGGFYLQLGAYTQAANAEAKRSRLEQASAGILMPIEVVASQGWYRLYSGPFATRADAAVAAQKMQDGGVAKPMIVQK